MNTDLLFNICSGIAACGWIVLFFVSPYWKNFDRFIIGVVAVLLGIIYTWMNVINWDLSILQHFFSLEGVATLLQNRELLIACWAHILCVDLIMATWIKKNSLLHGIKHIVIVPALLFSYAFGPFGFILYLLIRWVVTKKYFADNF